MKYCLAVVSLFFLFPSCTTKSQRDYVQLEVPPVLESHPEAVEHIEEVASRINRIMNSLDDFVVSLEELMASVVSLDTSMSKNEMTRIVEKEMDKMGKTYLKIFANVGYFQYRMMKDEKRQKEIENNLSGDALECFRQNCYKLRLNKELIDQRGNEIMTSMENMSKLLEEKKIAFEKKYGKRD